jgi:hypothetical protein
MVKIRVTCGGCGIEYTDEYGNTRHMLKTGEDGPFDCEEAAAARLVELGVAEYAGTWMAPGDGGRIAEGILIPGRLPDVESLDEEEGILQECEAEEMHLRSMRVKELELMAKSQGLDTKGCVRKDDYVALILATAQEGEADEEEPPVLTGEDPV